MARYAQIVDGIVAATLDRQVDGVLCVDITDQPDIRGGEAYDATAGTFASPEPLAVESEPIPVDRVEAAAIAVWACIPSPLMTRAQLEDVLRKTL